MNWFENLQEMLVVYIYTLANLFLCVHAFFPRPILGLPDGVSQAADQFQSEQKWVCFPPLKLSLYTFWFFLKYVHAMYVYVFRYIYIYACIHVYICTCLYKKNVWQKRGQNESHSPRNITHIFFTGDIASQAAHKGRNWLLVRSHQGLHLLITDHEVGRTRVLCHAIGVP